MPLFPFFRDDGWPNVNTTFDYFEAGDEPPTDAPTIAAVNAWIRPSPTGRLFETMEAENPASGQSWTDVLEIADSVAIDENWPGYATPAHVYIPDQDGDQYRVVFVERVRDNRPGPDFKRLYIRFVAAADDDDGDPGDGDGEVETDCCPGLLIPKTLYLTVSNVVGANCSDNLEGFSIPMLHEDAIPGLWSSIADPNHCATAARNKDSIFAGPFALDCSNSPPFPPEQECGLVCDQTHPKWHWCLLFATIQCSAGTWLLNLYRAYSMSNAPSRDATHYLGLVYNIVINNTFALACARPIAHTFSGLAVPAPPQLGYCPCGAFTADFTLTE